MEKNNKIFLKTRFNHTMICFKLTDSDKIRGTYVNHNNCTRNKEKNKGTRGTEAIVKESELNDFVVHLS